jgi:hypothetical protein
MKFHYLDLQNKTCGPVSLEELKVLIKAGVAASDPMVIIEDGTDWERMSVVASSNDISGDRISGSPSLTTGKSKSVFYLVIAVGAVGLLAGLLSMSPNKTSAPTLNNDVKTSSSAAETKARNCNACINNLRQIDAAANQFALENRKRTGDPISFPSDLTPYIKLTDDSKIPPCPDGGVYTLTKVGDTPTCSIPGHVLP